MINKFLYWLLKKKYGDIDKEHIMKEILKRRNFVESAYKGGLIYTEGFVYILFADGVIKIGNDCSGNNPQILELDDITGFIISLNYHHRYKSFRYDGHD